MSIRLNNWAFILAFVLLFIAGARSQSSMEVYRSDRDSKKGYLGVMIQDVTPRLKEKKHLGVDYGALVTDVTEDSPAEKAGINEDDVIVSFDGKKIEDASDLTSAVSRTKPKTEVAVELYRGEAKKTVTAKISKASGFSYSFGNSMMRIPRPPRIAMAMPHVFMGSEIAGLQVQEIGKQLAEYFGVPGKRGVLVTEVETGSSAEKSGFKAGDIVVKVNGAGIRTPSDLREEIDSKKKGDIPVDVIRKGSGVSLTLHYEPEEEEDDDGESYTPGTAPMDHDWSLMAPRAIPRAHHEDLRWLQDRIRSLQDEIRNEVEKVRVKIERALLRI